jgi:hypothetical protein
MNRVSTTRRYVMPKNTGQVHVKCKIERSPFSDERIFSLTLPDGSEHIGAASYIYFTDRNGHRLKENEPHERPISGMVEAVIIRDEGDTYLVSFADGSVAPVAKIAVKVSKEAPPDVPVQP